MASIGTHPSLHILAQLSPQNRANFQKVLHASDGTKGLIGQEGDGTQVAMATIKDGAWTSTGCIDHAPFSN